MGDDNDPRPWLRLDRRRPHRRVGGLVRGTDAYEWRCTRDGQIWPPTSIRCPHDKQ